MKNKKTKARWVKERRQLQGRRRQEAMENRQRRSEPQKTPVVISMEDLDRMLIGCLGG